MVSPTDKDNPNPNLTDNHTMMEDSVGGVAGAAPGATLVTSTGGTTAVAMGTGPTTTIPTLATTAMVGVNGTIGTTAAIGTVDKRETVVMGRGVMGIGMAGTVRRRTTAVANGETGATAESAATVVTGGGRMDRVRITVAATMPVCRSSAVQRKMARTTGLTSGGDSRAPGQRSRRQR